MDPPLGLSRFDVRGRNGRMNYKFENKVSDREVYREYCLDTLLNDPKTAGDVNVYKDVIIKLIEDITKLRRENLELKDTVLAFTKRLPQVFQSLSSLSATIEAEAPRFFARKAKKCEEETDYSTPEGEGSLTGEDYVESDLQDESSDEESRHAVVSISEDGTPQPVQNFVEVVSEENNTAEDGSRMNVNSLHSNREGCNSNFKQRKDDEKKSSVINLRTSPNNANCLKQFRQNISSSNEKLTKSSPVNGAQNKTEVNCPKEIKKTFGSALKDPQDKEDVNLPEAKESREVPDKIKEEQKQESPLEVSSFARSTGMSSNTSSSSSDRRNGQQRIFSCDICGRTFSRSSNLLHHAMRHRNERPHKCKICDRAFVQKANLKVHLRSHTGERPYACDECGKAFAQKNNALRHLRAHARQRQRQEKKLECRVCGKSFGRGPLYETHIRRAHTSAESQNAIDCIGDGKGHSSISNMNVCPQIVTINIPHQESTQQYVVQFSQEENTHSSAMSSVMPHAVLA